MKNSYFLFKQFRVCHDRCAMKVGTDGVLLGAWGSVEGRRILDIGTGTGLIALMAAQRNADAQVLGIDIDEAAVLQARENASGSPFRDRITIRREDVLTFRPDEFFDAILCNPPFFSEDTTSPDARRAMARQGAFMPFGRLVAKVVTFLHPVRGRFSVILPTERQQEFIGLCLREGLFLRRRLIVHTREEKPPRRVLMTFSLVPVSETEEESIVLTSSDGTRSEAYRRLTSEFYLEVGEHLNS